MKALLLLSVIATGMTITASTVRFASLSDFMATIRSITIVGETQAQSRRMFCAGGAGTQITVIIAI